MEEFFGRIEELAHSGEGIGREDALRVLSVPRERLFRLLDVADGVRRAFRGDEIRLCSIVNARSGGCSEDCSFCAQSSVSTAAIRPYPLLSAEEMVAAAREAKERGAREFSIVASGLAVAGREELARIGDAVEAIARDVAIPVCASLGTLGEEEVAYLLSRGLSMVHHNLETSRSFFPRVCTTHDYERDVAAVRAAKAAGAFVCCGGIFGLGESAEDRVELSLSLRELDVDAIPVNFLNPVEGTPLAGVRELSPLDCLRILAMLRLCHPAREIVVCGGREANLRHLQPLMFAAGASGTMLGNYLTTAGRDGEEDLRMLADLELSVRPAGAPRPLPAA
jgi:biotin synthase